MKISSVLILFVIANVLADDMEDYVKAVAITNIHFQKASEVNDDLLGNGLVNIINNIVTQRISIEEMCLMISTPDKPNLQDLRASIHTMEFLQRNIPDEMLGPVPPDQTFENSNLTDLGETRRRLSGAALKKLIAQKLDEFEPLSRDTGPNLFKMSRPLWYMPLHEAIIKMISLNEDICNCIGLWISTTTSSLTSVHTHRNGDCTLDGDGHKIEYRIFDNTYWQVEAENIGERIKELRVQLEE